MNKYISRVIKPSESHHCRAERIDAQIISRNYFKTILETLQARAKSWKSARASKANFSA